MPLPTLADSCDRFIQWCAPLLDADELDRTRAALATFRAADGPARQVQRMLEEYAADPDVDSWLDDFWRYRYLGRRDRIALNANFFLLLQGRPGRDLEGTFTVDAQAATAALIIEAATSYHHAVSEGHAAATRNGKPLSMVGNRHLFSTTRIPGTPLDTVRSPYTSQWPGPSRARHVLVLYHGAMFQLDAIDRDGVPHTPQQLARAVQDIKAAAPAQGQAMGHLTTLPRADWAQTRESLASQNADALDGIERALFCLCLDDVTPASQEAACAQLLAGDSGNRWFDKSLSFIVFSDGTAGVNVEHCLVDGTNVIDLVDAMYATQYDTRTDALSNRPAEPAWQTVLFTLASPLARRIEQAGRDFAEYTAENAMSLRTYHGFGSDLAKRLGISPDAFVQLAIQLAHQQAKGFIGTTYESVSTRHFHHGRTEAMRVITPEIVALAATMTHPAASAEDRASAVRVAATAHVARARECQEGQAPEQHLWELQLLASRRKLNLPQDLYESPGWTVMREDYLSTSAVASSNIAAFGFGATSKHCIGVAYVLLPDRLTVHLATPRSSAGALPAFGDALADALVEIGRILS